MTSLTITPLPYTKDLITHYQALSDLPGYVLLESSDKQRGRYDIVTALPYDEVKLLNHSPNLHDAFNQLQTRLPTTKSLSALPFQGGAIGYISYDLGASLAGIHATPHPANDMPTLHMRFYDWAIIADHQQQEVHLVAAHSQPETTAILHDVRARWDRQLVKYPSFTLQQAFSPIITQQAYQQAFHAIYQELVRGRSYQVNYTQPFLGQYRGDTWELYKRIRQANPVPYSAFIRGDSGDILSFSPERFLQIEQGHVLTSPIKGTVQRSNDAEQDRRLKASLLASAKNRAENVMIVDLLRNDLGKFAKPGSVRVTSLCELQSFNAVHHLVSNIEAQCIDTTTTLEAFAACFPGGSITGAPKREAMRIISEHEPYSRGVYCGSIAYFSSHGRLDSNIAIRTITAKEKYLYLPVGGGIVIDSNWEDEYRECFTKITAILQSLGV